MEEKNPKDWQEEFDRLTDSIESYGEVEILREFIQSLLDQQKKEILEKLTLDKQTPFDYEKSDYDAANIVMDKEKVGYNQAVSDLEALKQEIMNPKPVISGSLKEGEIKRFD